MEILILCFRTPVCYAVWRVVQQAIRNLRPRFPEVEFKVNISREAQEIAHHSQNLLRPTLMVNNKMVCTGYIPSEAEVLGWLQMALAQAGFQPAVLDR